MKKIVSRVLWGALAVGGFMTLGCGVANAAESSAEGGDSLLSGNIVQPVVVAPLTATGNSAALGGEGDHGSRGDATSVVAPVTAPQAKTSADGGDAAAWSSSKDEGGTRHDKGHGSTGDTDTTATGGDSIGSGNIVQPVVVAPVTATGNSAVVGGEGRQGSEDATSVVVPVTAPQAESSADAGNAHAASTSTSSEDESWGHHGKGDKGDNGSEGDTTATATGGDSIASGNIVQPTIVAPVTATGNSFDLFGESRDGYRGGSHHGHDKKGHGGQDNGDATGIVAPVTAPQAETFADAGNAHAVSTSSEDESRGHDGKGDRGSEGDTTATATGGDSIASGNIVQPTLVAPVTATGNSLTLFGEGSEEGDSTSIVAPWTAPGSATSADAGDAHAIAGSTGSDGSGTTEASATGGSSLLSGNILQPTAVLPITATGNSITVVDTRGWDRSDWGGHGHSWKGDHGKGGHGKGDHGKCDHEKGDHGEGSWAQGNGDATSIVTPVTVPGASTSADAGDATAVSTSSGHDGWGHHDKWGHEKRGHDKWRHSDKGDKKSENNTIATAIGGDSIASGNILQPTFVAPLTATGNSLTVFGGEGYGWHHTGSHDGQSSDAISVIAPVTAPHAKTSADAGDAWAVAKSSEDEGSGHHDGCRHGEER